VFWLVFFNQFLSDYSEKSVTILSEGFRNSKLVINCAKHFFLLLNYTLLCEDHFLGLFLERSDKMKLLAGTSGFLYYLSHL